MRYELRDQSWSAHGQVIGVAHVALRGFNAPGRYRGLSLQQKHEDSDHVGRRPPSRHPLLSWLHSLVRLAATALTVLLTLALLAPRGYSLTLQKGDAAAPLQLSALLQAPAGSRADWAALRGKVVVLEFWATWCAPCVASIPHLNELAASVDPDKVQFISIDDEPAEVVRGFIARKHMAGWIGLDSLHVTSSNYGVTQLPVAVLVDGRGKIAAITSLDKITTEVIRNLQQSGSVPSSLTSAASAAEKLTPPSKAVPSLNTPSGASAPLFSLSLEKASLGDRFKIWHFPSEELVIESATAAYLISYAFGLPEDRLVFEKPILKDNYTLRANLAGLPDAGAQPVLRTAILSGLHLQAKLVKKEADALVLRREPHSPLTGLQPSATDSNGMVGVWNGKIHLVHASIDDLAMELETELGKPVVNETGVSGSYDGEVSITKGSVEETRSYLASELGFELISARRSVDTVVITPVATLK